MRRKNPRAYGQGFTLLELSVVLVIMSAMIGGMTAFFIVFIERGSAQVTQERLRAVQENLLLYGRAHGYLPCPAPMTTAPSDTAYGRGAGTGAESANCTSETYSSGNVVAGLVPVRELGLPDTMAIDGWGRRILYAVDQRITEEKAYLVYPQDTSALGAITVQDETADARTTSAVYAVVSFGKNGHGAYGAEETSNRQSLGITNANELENCDCDSDGDDGTFDGVFVQQRLKGSGTTTSFDDEVRYVLYRDLNS